MDLQFFYVRIPSTRKIEAKSHFQGDKYKYPENHEDLKFNHIILNQIYTMDTYILHIHQKRLIKEVKFDNLASKILLFHNLGMYL